MKSFKLILLFSIIYSSLFSQDLILTKDNKVLEVSVKSVNKDSIIFLNKNDTVNKVQAISQGEVRGILYKEGKELKSGNINLVKEIYKIRRVKKSGFHMGLVSFFGTAYGLYYNEKLKDSYFSDRESLKFRNIFVVTEELNIKYFINYVLSVTTGIGYNSTMYDVISLKNDGFNGQYSLNTIQIPLRLSFTPGAKFGFLFENGLSFRIPVHANCTESYWDEAYNRVNTRQSYMNSVDKFGVYLESTVGFHGTIRKQFILQGGLIQMFLITNKTVLESTNGSENLGIKLSLTYRLNTSKE